MLITITILDAITSVMTVILSAGIAFWVSHRQKKLEYQDDYRKYILDKRKKVYDQIEITISHLTTFQFDSLNNEHCHVFMLSADSVAKFEQEIIDLLRQGYWMSYEMAALLTKVNLTFIEINTKQHYKDSPTDAWGKEYFKDFYKLGDKLKEIYFFDVMNLDNLSLFKKNNSAQVLMQIGNHN